MTGSIRILYACGGMEPENENHTNNDFTDDEGTRRRPQSGSKVSIEHESTMDSSLWKVWDIGPMN